MSEDLLSEFIEYWGARGWKMELVNNPSGYIEFRNANTHNIWMGWKAARETAALRELCVTAGKKERQNV